MVGRPSPGVPVCEPRARRRGTPPAWRADGSVWQRRTHGRHRHNILGPTMAGGVLGGQWVKQGIGAAAVADANGASARARAGLLGHPPVPKPRKQRSIPIPSGQPGRCAGRRAIRLPQRRRGQRALKTSGLQAPGLGNHTGRGGWGGRPASGRFRLNMCTHSRCGGCHVSPPGRPVDGADQRPEAAISMALASELEQSRTGAVGPTQELVPTNPPASHSSAVPVQHGSSPRHTVLRRLQAFDRHLIGPQAALQVAR